MNVLFMLLPVAFGDEGFGKDTYAMSHPFAFKDFMEKYLPTAEFTIEENSTSTCNEWVKLCIDDGHMESCNGPTGNNFQLHSVGAYMRDPGAKSMEQIETEFTQSMGDMTKYDPYFEYHMAFLTEDLDSYVSTFDSDKVPYFASTWTDPSTKKAYKSILFQVPGSLGANAKSLLNIAILCNSSSILEARTDLYFHFSPRAFPEALAAGHARLASAPRKLSSSGKPVLVKMHRSFASSDVSRDSKYFESAMQGTKLYDATIDDEKVYAGKLQSGDVAGFRYAETSANTQGPTSVADWEAYQVSLHQKCFDLTKNQGFDRLADNHVGEDLASGSIIDAYVKGQMASGYPYRFYKGLHGNMHFFYMYGPNGWGLQIIGALTDTSLGPPAETGYDFCTQGIKGSCSVDKTSNVLV